MVKKIVLTVVICLATLLPVAQIKPVSIHHEGWIDFNKNGVKDVFEDPAQPVERRIADLLGSMTLEEKTCQTATLYGFGRVLKDELPTPGWKNEVWKDGIANIDEHLNGVAGRGPPPTPPFHPFPRRAAAITTSPPSVLCSNPHGEPAAIYTQRH